MSQTFSLAIDAMGGDAAPDMVLDGLELAAERHPQARFLVVGDEARIGPLLARRKRAAATCAIRHAPDVIPGEMKPTAALRQGRQSSMRLAIDAVAAGDHLARLGLVDVDDIRRHAASAKGRNCRVMRRSAALIDGRRESPLESWSAVRFAEWGLPSPEWQVDIHDDIGHFVGRVDAWWPEQRVAGEADGLAKYTEREVLVAEKRREDRLRALGLQVIRWTWSDLSNTPWRLHGRLERALRPH